MLAKLLVILAVASIRNVLADDGLLNSIYSIGDDLMTDVLNDGNDKTEVKGEVKDGEEDDVDEGTTVPEEDSIGTEPINVAKEENNGSKENTSATSNFDDSEWDCIAYSDNIVQCTPKKMTAAFEREAPSSGGAGIPTSPPKGYPEPQKDVHIKGPLVHWIDDFFGAISKIHDQIKESIELPLKKILGD